MDILFLEQFKSHYSAKLLVEGFSYEDHNVSEPKTFDGKEFSVLTIPNSNGDVIHIEESKKDNSNKSRLYDLHFEFNTEDNAIKTSRMIQYLDTIFDVNFKSIKSIHDNYVQAGLDIGLFIKTGDVLFTPNLLLLHFDTSVVNKKNSLVIANLKYNPVVKKLIRNNSVDLKCNLSQSFEKGVFKVDLSIRGLFFDQHVNILQPNGSEIILISKPSQSTVSTVDTLTRNLLYTYFYDYFKERIEIKFLNMGVDLNNTSQELFNKYLDVLAMVKI